MSEKIDPKQPRHCKICNQTVAEINPSTWPHSLGKPLGAVCRPCARARKREFDAQYKKARMEARAAGVATLDPQTATTQAGLGGGAVAKVSSEHNRLPGELDMRKLPVARALREGAAVINEKAASIMGRLVGYADDPASPHHEWALKLLAERVIPKALFDELARKEVGGVGGAGGPRISINIMAAQAPAHGEARVIDVTPIVESTGGVPDEGAENGD